VLKIKIVTILPVHKREPIRPNGNVRLLPPSDRRRDKNKKNIKIVVFTRFLYCIPFHHLVCVRTGELKSRIVEALSDATSKRKWGKRFEKFGLIGFADNSDDAYLEYNQSSSQKGLSAIYY
jgi:hypothetical protein